MVVFPFFFALLWERAPGWGFKDGVLHNSIWLGEIPLPISLDNATVFFIQIKNILETMLAKLEERNMEKHNILTHLPKPTINGMPYSADSIWFKDSQSQIFRTDSVGTMKERAAGVYHREGRSGKYQLTYAEAKAVCEYEGGHLATYQQLEAARKIGFHMCAAGWMAKGRVGYPIVKPGSNCGFGKTGIVDYGFRLNRSERWDAYCYNPNGKDCGGVFTDSKYIFKTPGYPNEYENDQICYWHIRVKYGQRVQIQFVDFDLEEDASCMSDYLEIYDSYDDVNGFVGRYCGDELPDPIVSTGNVMTLKFLSDASVTAGGFQIKYVALDPPKKSAGKNATTQSNTNYLAGKFGIM